MLTYGAGVQYEASQRVLLRAAFDQVRGKGALDRLNMVGVTALYVF
jgi:hypothetical protein